MELPRTGDLLLGTYLLEEQLGAGGMGVVFAAQHQLLGTRVAVKFLLPHIVKSGDPDEDPINSTRNAAAPIPLVKAAGKTADPWASSQARAPVERRPGGPARVLGAVLALLAAAGVGAFVVSRMKEDRPPVAAPPTVTAAATASTAAVAVSAPVVPSVQIAPAAAKLDVKAVVLDASTKAIASASASAAPAKELVAVDSGASSAAAIGSAATAPAMTASAATPTTAGTTTATATEAPTAPEPAKTTSPELVS